MLCCFTPQPLLTLIICSGWFFTADDSFALWAFPVLFWPKNCRMRRQFPKYLTWQFRQHSNRYVNKIITFRFRPFWVPFNTPFPLIQREFRFEMMSQGMNCSVVMCVWQDILRRTQHSLLRMKILKYVNKLTKWMSRRMTKKTQIHSRQTNWRHFTSHSAVRRSIASQCSYAWCLEMHSYTVGWEIGIGNGNRVGLIFEKNYEWKKEIQSKWIINNSTKLQKISSD